MKWEKSDPCSISPECRELYCVFVLQSLFMEKKGESFETGDNQRTFCSWWRANCCNRNLADC